jgi:hypothetical protein
MEINKDTSYTIKYKGVDYERSTNGTWSQYFSERLEIDYTEEDCRDLEEVFQRIIAKVPKPKFEVKVYTEPEDVPDEIPEDMGYDKDFSPSDWEVIKYPLNGEPLECGSPCTMMSDPTKLFVQPINPLEDYLL